ncbi:hypothetical protein DFH06DRAFT_1149933 [Mycena polygramma]|nr:hypothetical protein DFH06DRAFT_1149933 [Mycena polygramma]
MASEYFHDKSSSKLEATNKRQPATCRLFWTHLSRERAKAIYMQKSVQFLRGDICSVRRTEYLFIKQERLTYVAGQAAHETQAPKTTVLAVPPASFPDFDWETLRRAEACQATTDKEPKSRPSRAAKLQSIPIPRSSRLLNDNAPHYPVSNAAVTVMRDLSWTLDGKARILEEDKRQNAKCHKVLHVMKRASMSSQATPNMETYTRVQY